MSRRSAADASSCSVDPRATAALDGAQTVEEIAIKIVHAHNPSTSKSEAAKLLDDASSLQGCLVVHEDALAAVDQG